MDCRLWTYCVAATLVVLAPACRRVPPTVSPDAVVHVDEVAFEGFDVLPAHELEDLRDRVPLRAGAALTEKAEQETGTAAVEALQNHARPYANVAIVRQPRGGNRASVIVRAEPGTFGYFGPIDIAGNRNVEDAVIRRRVAYAPGDPFSRSAIQRSQQRIGALGLFKSVEIRAHGIDAQPAEVPTIITVEERSPWQWNLSLGYAAGERLGIGGRISHLNFFGAARRLDVEGRVSRIDRQLQAGFTQVEAWHPSLSLSLEARHWELDEHAFDVLSRGGQAAVGWRWTPRLSTTLSYATALERSDVIAGLDVLTGLQDGILNAWSVDLVHLVAHNDSLEPAPTYSSAVNLHVEQAGGWLPGTFHYYNAVGDVRRYRPLAGDRLVVAGRLRYGSLVPMTDDSAVPLLKRFFLGGSNEMRGWGRYEVSPLSPVGAAVGGKSFFSATAEMRFPIMSRIRGVLFAEAGTVWQDPWAGSFGELLYDAGPGVRLDTPFGLIRVDVGYQLKMLAGLRIEGRPQKHRWRINFGIGEAF